MVIERLAFESKGLSPRCYINTSDLLPEYYLKGEMHRSYLFCPRCGGELRGGLIVRYQMGGEEDTYLFCPKKNGCGFFVEGREAVYEVKAAIQELERIKKRRKSD